MSIVYVYYIEYIYIYVYMYTYIYIYCYVHVLEVAVYVIDPKSDLKLLKRSLLKENSKSSGTVKGKTFGVYMETHLLSPADTVKAGILWRCR